MMMQRLKPSFFIIGERKCGTSSVYRYLLEHPQVLPCRVKEPQFFSRPGWYRLLFRRRYNALFPFGDATSAPISWFDLDADGGLIAEELLITRHPEKQAITGEASANTFARVPPRRLFHAFPKAKLILCLRHPVDRAFAHYRMLERFAAEGRRIPIRLTDFRSDFIEDIRRVRKGETGYFAGPGFYTENLKAWTNVFGGDQVFLIRTEDLHDLQLAQRVLDDVCSYLKIENYDFAAILTEKVNVAPSRKLDPALRAELFAFYEEDIFNLEHFTGRKMDWNP